MKTGDATRLVLLIGLVALLFFHRLGDRDLWGSHEARAAQDAQRMLDDGAFGLPRLFDDRDDLQKPPLYYWLAAGVGRLNDGRVDAFAVRLPAALAAAGCVALVYFVPWRRGRPMAAFLAALALATAQHYTWLSRTARIDMPLTLATAVAVLAVVEGSRWRILGFVAMAAGVLLKGPIGLVLPVAVILLDALASRRVCPGGPGGIPTARASPAARIRMLLWGVPLALALALPWFVWANWHTRGEFYRVFVVYHNIQRAAGGADELAVHPWWYYGPRLLVDALPWSLAVVPAVVWVIWRGVWRTDPLARLGLVWLAVVVGVLSCAKFKRADYLLPAYPGLALLLGCVGERLWLEATPAVRRGLRVGTAAVVALVIGGWAYLLHVELPRHERQREMATFARAIRERCPAPQVVLFFRAEAHALSYHLGRPVNTFLEWENLDVWAGRPGPHYIVMPPECAAAWREHVTAGELVEVLRNTDLAGGRHEKPLVLMMTRPATEARDARPLRQAADRPRPDQRGPDRS